RWGTPALDLGAGVRAQLSRNGCRVIEAGTCTLEDRSWHSHRRDQGRSGRAGGVVWRMRSGDRRGDRRGDREGDRDE
ncbi:MAG: laccase domain-containing protein, partial [Nocardioides sp.]